MKKVLWSVLSASLLMGSVSKAATYVCYDQNDRTFKTALNTGGMGTAAPYWKLETGKNNSLVQVTKITPGAPVAGSHTTQQSVGKIKLTIIPSYNEALTGGGNPDPGLILTTNPNPINYLNMNLNIILFGGSYVQFAGGNNALICAEEK
ncbi:MAG: hypothetical protein ACOYOK_06615 [Pseudobdellovibrionaceae bacterium]